MAHIDQYWAPLEQALIPLAHPEQAEKMSKYMRSQFPFYGIPSNSWRTVYRQFKKEQDRVLRVSLMEGMRWCWDQPQREWQYIGMQWLFDYKRHLTVDDAKWMPQYLVEKAWWDTIDFLAPKVWGYWFQQFPERRDAIIAGWVNSDQLWWQRSAIIFQLGYKSSTDRTLLYEVIAQLKGKQDFFIRKAIGWALRQYGKVQPEWVTQAVDELELTGLSRREALKHLA